MYNGSQNVLCRWEDTANLTPALLRYLLFFCCSCNFVPTILHLLTKIRTIPEWNLGHLLPFMCHTCMSSYVWHKYRDWFLIRGRWPTSALCTMYAAAQLCSEHSVNPHSRYWRQEQLDAPAAWPKCHTLIQIRLSQPWCKCKGSVAHNVCPTDLYRDVRLLHIQCPTNPAQQAGTIAQLVLVSADMAHLGFPLPPFETPHNTLCDSTYLTVGTDTALQLPGISILPCIFLLMLKKKPSGVKT